MTRNRLSATLGVATLALTMVCGAAEAKGRHHGGPGDGPRGGRGFGGPDRGIHHAMAELDLSDDQKQQLAEIRDEQRADRREQHDQMRAARQALDEAIHADTVDEGAIRAAAKALAELEADMAVARARSFQKLKGILTSEQVAKLEELKSQREARLESRRERRKLRGNPEADLGNDKPDSNNP